jgi:hypothetical protein
MENERNDKISFHFLKFNTPPQKIPTCTHNKLNSITNAKLTLPDIELKKYQQKNLSSLIESVQFKKLNGMLDSLAIPQSAGPAGPSAGRPGHALTLKKGGYVNTRHNTIRNTILGFTRQARITAHKEKGSHGSDRTPTGPADVQASFTAAARNPFGDLRSPQAVDVTIVSSLTIENLKSGAGNKGGMKVAGPPVGGTEENNCLNTPTVTLLVCRVLMALCCGLLWMLRRKG